MKKPPECKICHNRATLYDTQAGGHYCSDCLEESFIGEKEMLKEYTEEYEGN